MISFEEKIRRRRLEVGPGWRITRKQNAQAYGGITIYIYA